MHVKNKYMDKTQKKHAKDNDDRNVLNFGWGEKG